MKEHPLNTEEFVNTYFYKIQNGDLFIPSLSRREPLIEFKIKATSWRCQKCTISNIYYVINKDIDYTYTDRFYLNARCYICQSQLRFTYYIRNTCPFKLVKSIKI